ncbi:Uncharacterised protein [Mycobacteroides abscessus subsp. abscessus]|nr:Uncharacterised protein [Mycobacteroides abscessus subsp. abscessus]
MQVVLGRGQVFEAGQVVLVGAVVMRRLGGCSGCGLRVGEVRGGLLVLFGCQRRLDIAVVQIDIGDRAQQQFHAPGQSLCPFVGPHMVAVGAGDEQIVCGVEQFGGPPLFGVGRVDGGDQGGPCGVGEGVFGDGGAKESI